MKSTIGRQVIVVAAVVALSLSACRKSAVTPNQSDNATSSGSYLGSLDGYADDNLVGWAMNELDTKEAVMINFYESDTLIGAAKAEILRKDLQEKRIGTGYYGFSFPVPANLRDGKSHQIHARVKGSNTELSNSPKSFVFSSK